MIGRKWLAALVLGPTVGAAWAKDAPTSWDGLVEVKPKRMDAVFLLPGADFRPYTRVILDPTQVAFRKDWLKDTNDARERLSSKVTEQDAAEILAAARSNFDDIFQAAFTKAGYPVVTTPGPDVVRISTAVINLYLNAPDTMSSGRSRTYTANAGEATLVMEVRDSSTGALLGRIVDRRETVNSPTLQLATRVSNTAGLPPAVQGLGRHHREGDRGTQGAVAGPARPRAEAEAVEADARCHVVTASSQPSSPLLRAGVARGVAIRRLRRRRGVGRRAGTDRHRGGDACLRTSVRAACRDCHVDEYRRWEGSQHAVAMQVADERTVLGDFSGVKFRTRRRDQRILPPRRQVHGRAPTAPTASSPTSRCGTPSACTHCSSTWSSCPAAACRHCRSRGTRGRRTRAASAGSTCTRTSVSPTTTSCTGRSASRTGTSCAPTATRPTCARTTTPRRAPLRPAGPRPASAARRATVRAAGTSRCAKAAPAATRHPHPAGSRSRSTSGAALPGSSIRRRATPTRTTPRATSTELDVCAQCHARRGQFSDDYEPGKPFTDHYLPALLERGAVLPRRPAARRGLQLGLLPVEPHAREGRHLQRLPRSARRQAARARQRGVRAVPRRGEIRRPIAPFPRRGHARRGLRRVPHEDRDLHGGGSAP